MPSPSFSELIDYIELSKQWEPAYQVLSNSRKVPTNWEMRSHTISFKRGLSVCLPLATAEDRDSY